MFRKKIQPWKLQNNVAEYPFDDHLLQTQSTNFIGKLVEKRSLICCWCTLQSWKKKNWAYDMLLYALHKLISECYDSLKYYGIMRTKNQKGVIIPGQIRYVCYFQKALQNNWLPSQMPQKNVEPEQIKLIGMPHQNMWSINDEKTSYVEQQNQTMNYYHTNTDVTALEKLISNQKIRYNLIKGLNLDLSYITYNIIAMRFPAENFESGNSMKNVQIYFRQEHPNQYRIYNLCSERKYDHSNFENNVVEYPFDDGQVPSLDLIYKFCVDLDNWLKKDILNVAGVHCKAGKGRTGLMICCYMLFSNKFQNAQDSLKYYGIMRMKNIKGITQASQIRYVCYFWKALQNNWLPSQMPQKNVELEQIKLIGMPNSDMFSVFDPFFCINNHDKSLHSKFNIDIQRHQFQTYFSFNLNGIALKGDVLLEFYNKSLMSNEKIFQLWFNCDFIDDTGVLIFDQSILDIARQDIINKKFPQDLRVEITTVQADSNSLKQDKITSF